MMNSAGKTAKLYFGDGHFDMMSPGDHVLCAVTGQRIHLTQLKYWSVDRQEAYASARIAAGKSDPDSVREA